MKSFQIGLLFPFLVSLAMVFLVGCATQVSENDKALWGEEPKSAPAQAP
jgi:hypothetical protein